MQTRLHIFAFAGASARMKYKRPRASEEWFYTPPDDLLAAVGRVAINSASIEDLMHSLYWKYVEVPPEVAAIITGDQKSTRLSEDIVKVAVALDEDPDRVQDLRDLFADFKELNEKRNQCIHWMWHRPRQWKRGRKHWLKPPSYKPKRSPIPFTVKQINALADDLAWIELRMRVHLLDEEEFEKERKELRFMAHVAVPAPWLDKHRKLGPIRWPPWRPGKKWVRRKSALLD
jgi:hypothetical protein